MTTLPAQLEPVEGAVCGGETADGRGYEGREPAGG